LGGRRCRSWVQSIGRADAAAPDGGPAGDAECGGGVVDAGSGPRHRSRARTLVRSSTSVLASAQRSFDMVNSTSRPFASRRTVLAAGGVTTAAAALAACGGGPDDAGGGGGGEAPAEDFEERGPITLAKGKDTTGKLAEFLETWNSEHPDEEVTLIELPESADEQRTQMINNAQAKSDAYTVLGLDVV